jgi:hypothetical protein
LTVNSGSIKFGHVIFGACQTGHMACLLGQVSSEGNPYTINAPSLTHMSVGEAGYMTITRSAVSIVGNPHFSQMFIQAAGASTVYAGGCAFAGAATGYRYGVSLNAIIVTNTGDENYLPGDLVGVKSTGGQYI